MPLDLHRVAAPAAIEMTLAVVSAVGLAITGTVAAAVEVETVIGLGLKVALLEQRLAGEAAARSQLEHELAGERNRCAQLEQRLGAAETVAQPQQLKGSAALRARVERNAAPLLRERIERVLREAGGGPIHSDDLRAALPDVSAGVLRAVLSRLAAAGEVSSVPVGGGRSAWRLEGDAS